MYMTRIPLDSSNRETMRALYAPNRFHGAVESAFSGERKRRLWRIDRLNGQLYLLLISEEQPDTELLLAQFGSGTQAAQCKCYDDFLNRIASGRQYHFRLTANPTKAIRNENGERGTVAAHITAGFQKEWLLKQSEKHGFALDEDAFNVVQNKWHKFRKGSTKHSVSLFSVTYEGILTVADAELFRTVLTHGIGRGKAYGMGMLTVIPV
jgi:CRISPR system Cascade subunit CasE